MHYFSGGQNVMSVGEYILRKWQIYSSPLVEFSIVVSFMCHKLTFIL